MTSTILTETSLWLLVAGMAGMVLVLSGFWLVLRRQRQQLQRQDALIATLRQDLRALTTAAVGVGERVLETEQRQRRLAERQDQLDLYDAANQPYEQAIRLVHKGADVEELVEICGLNRGEAELIRMLHRLDKSA